MNAGSLDAHQALALDTRSLQGLREAASRDPDAALRETAKQFEALFMREMLKSMRAATAAMKSGLLDSAGGDLATDMLDAQFAGTLAGGPGGIGEMIARQLSGAMGLGEPPVPGSLTGSVGLPPARTPAIGRPAPRDLPDAPPRAEGAQGEFLRQHWDAAKAAEAASGIPASFILAQAAHESGWGRHEIAGEGGEPSYNLFGIKATGGWRGRVAQITTTEVTDGVARKVKAGFRAYGSYEEAFQDYARLLSRNPRYAEVIENARSARGFAQGLQDAGYATDPQYAEKLERIINTTLRLQRASA